MKNDSFFDMDAEEYLEQNKSKKKEKSDEELLEEKIYERRCQLVKLSRSDYHKFINYLLEFENFFKSKMDERDKECMRRTCQSAWEKHYNQADLEDLDIFNRIFGPHIDIRKSKTVPIPDTQSYDRDEKPRTVEEEIRYRSLGTYYAMWDFITNPEFQEKLKGRADLYDKVKYMIERAKENNDYVTINMKRYEPSDEDMYVKVLNLMKVKE